jgi:hypothetical protein
VTSLIKYRAIIIVSLLAALFYGHYYINRASVEIEIKAPGATTFRIYWASEGEQSYSNDKMAQVRIKEGTHTYRFFLTDLRKIHSLRIDPASMPGTIAVKELSIRQPGLPTLHIATADEVSKLRPFGDVSSSTFSSGAWMVTSTGSQPRFQFLVPVADRDINWLAEGARFLLILLPALFLLQMLQALWPRYIYSAYFGVFALALIITMAVISVKYQHPDEVTHSTAVSYYQDNWLPPAVEDPDIRDTYSIYGFSRLNTLEPSYILTGKFVKILELFRMDPVLAQRLFNVLLFGILVFLSVRHISYRLLFIPLLLSPQIWYIFSYVNSDAFALFVAILTAWQMVAKDSALNRYLEMKQISILKLLGLGILIALLLLAKKTFYFFILFLLFYFGWRCIFEPFANLRGTLKRILVLACIAFSLISIRLAADVAVNGFDKGEKMIAMQELTAHPTYKISTELNKKHIHLQMRERGTTLKSFIVDHRWGEKTFRSGMGTYGYMTVAASLDYYNIMRVIGLAGLVFVALSIALRGGWSGNLLFAGAVFCCTTLITIACYRAWTVDFQAQGRYLFAIIPILGMVLVKTESVYNQTLLRSVVCCMFLLSTYSFIWIALLGVAKYGYS